MPILLPDRQFVAAQGWRTVGDTRRGGIRVLHEFPAILADSERVESARQLIPGGAQVAAAVELDDVRRAGVGAGLAVTELFALLIDQVGHRHSFATGIA